MGRREGVHNHGALGYIFTSFHLIFHLFIPSSLIRLMFIDLSKDRVSMTVMMSPVVRERGQGVLVLCARLPEEESEAWKGKVTCPKSHS